MTPIRKKNGIELGPVRVSRKIRQRSASIRDSLHPAQGANQDVRPCDSRFRRLLPVRRRAFAPALPNGRPSSAWHLKKAISRLSGDQKGSTALSVPARGVISRLSRARTQICCFPSFRRTTAMARPSGETARDMMRALSGSRMFMRATGSSAGFPRNHRNPSAADKSSATVGRPIHLCRCCPGLQCNRWIDLDRLLRTLSETPDSPGSPVKRFQWINPMCAG